MHALGSCSAVGCLFSNGLARLGWGGADKEQVARVILQYFPKMVAPDKADVTDALAVTLCGLWNAKQKQSIF